MDEADYVSMAHARDERGRAMVACSGIGQGHADGEEQQIVYFDGDKPATVAILFVASTSIRELKGEHAKHALTRLIKTGDARNRLAFDGFIGHVKSNEQLEIAAKEGGTTLGAAVQLGFYQTGVVASSGVHGLRVESMNVSYLVEARAYYVIK